LHNSITTITFVAVMNNMVIFNSKWISPNGNKARSPENGFGATRFLFPYYLSIPDYLKFLVDVEATSTGAGAVSTGAGSASTGAESASTGAGSVSTGAGAVSTGAGSVSTGAGSASTGARDAGTGARGVAPTTEFGGKGDIYPWQGAEEQVFSLLIPLKI
jgi:hypothetical protein